MKRHSTPLGYEFLKLMDHLEEYSISCAKLSKTIKQNFNITKYTSENIRRNLLRNQGWTSEDINSYEQLLSTSNKLSTYLISPYEVINIILIRYILVLSKIKENENAKTILDNIIMGKINDQLSNMIVPDIDGEQSKDTTDIQNAHSMYSNLIKDKIISVTKFMDDNYLPNKFTDTEVGNVLLSLFSVLNITKEDMKSTIEKISSEISAQEGNDALYLLKEACHEFF